MPEPINLADVSKNPKHIREGLAEWERANPAEIIEVMQRRGEVQNLKAKSFDRAYRPRIAVRSEEPSLVIGHGFRVGDRVVMTERAAKDAILSGDQTEGTVQVIRQELIRVNGVFYAPNRWRKAHV